jgi:Domain of unknown function (DUF4340)
MPMDRLSFKLTVILGAQLALALILWSFGSDHSAFKAKEPLLSFETGKVDRIDIAENGSNSITLVKEGGNWVIPSSANFPADAAKVSGLLNKLAGLKKGWPLASSNEAARRFKVTSDSFERRIALKSGGVALGEILLGNSPNFKTVSARAGSDSNVYSVAFSAYEAPARADDWMDRSLLNVTQDKIASISIGDVMLERKDGKFVLSGLGKDQKQDETATYKLVGALAYPVFDAVAGKGPDALDKVKDPDVTATIKLTEAAPIVLKYKKDPAGGAYLFTTSANGFLFRASDASAEPIVKAKRDALIEAPKKPEAEKAAATPAKPSEAETPKAPGDKGAAVKPAASEEHANAQEEGPDNAPQPAKAAEPAQAREERPEAAKTDEPQQTEDERFQAAMQPERAEPKKAEDGTPAPAEPQGGAGDGAQTPAPAAKPAEAQPDHGG